MLTMEMYNALSWSEKADAIMEGSFLTDREENGLIVQLYSVGTIYAEVTYDPLAHKILCYRVFEGTQQLVPYLAYIRFNPH
jgi:hypothetical protein